MNRILNFQTLHDLERNLIEKLSGMSLFQNKQIRNSPRAVGDTVQDVLGDILIDCFPEGLIDSFHSNFTRRSMEDVAFLMWMETIMQLILKHIINPQNLICQI